MNAKRKSAIWTLDSKSFLQIVKNSKTLKEILDKMGLPSRTGGNYKTLRSRFKEEKIDISHIEHQRKEIIRNAGIRDKIPLIEILVKNSTYTNNTKLKIRLIKEGIFEEKCHGEGCTVGNTWKGMPISLQLEHKNGINNDNRLENLCLLCPNCHSQTNTFAGKKTKIKRICKNCNNPISKNSISGLCKSCVRIGEKNTSYKGVCPPKEILFTQLLETNFHKVSKKYNVSVGAVKKWCLKYELPSSSKELNEYKKKISSS